MTFHSGAKLKKEIIVYLEDFLIFLFWQMTFTINFDNCDWQLSLGNFFNLTSSIVTQEVVDKFPEFRDLSDKTLQRN